MERGKKKAAGHLFLMCLLCVTVLLLNGTKVYAAEYDGVQVSTEKIQAGDIFKNLILIQIPVGDYIEVFVDGISNGRQGGGLMPSLLQIRINLSCKVTQISKNGSDWTIYLETYPPAASTQTQEKEKEERKEDVHQHSYQWMTVTEPAMDTDGVEEYRCSCGEVESRQVIPATETYVKTLYGEIREAPENGSIGYDAGRNHCLSDYVLKKLLERQDVTVTITFLYEEASYQFTIPAGTDLTALLEDEEYFYGYFTLCEKLGITVEVVE